MAVASLLGPDKGHIKDSRDIHLSLYIVLSDNFSRKTLVLWPQAYGTTTTVQLSISLVVRWMESQV